MFFHRILLDIKIYCRDEAIKKNILYFYRLPLSIEELLVVGRSRNHYANVNPRQIRHNIYSLIFHSFFLLDYMPKFASESYSCASFYMDRPILSLLFNFFFRL